VNDDAPPDGNGQTWATAYQHLQQALESAEPGEDPVQIWVAVGTYKPDQGTEVFSPGEREATFALRDKVEVYGGFAGTESTLLERAGLFEQTILSGDLDGYDNPEGEPNDPDRAENCYSVVTADIVESTARLDGFLITGGNANVAAHPNDIGGGMQTFIGSPLVKNCTFTKNFALAGGAGVVVEKSLITFEDCKFTSNLCTGGGVGAGMYVFELANVTLHRCEFRQNRGDASGGGIYIAGDSVVQGNGCEFWDNVSDNGDGGGIYLNGSSTRISQFINSVLVRNEATRGGGLYLWGTVADFVNVKYIGNQARGGGYASDGGAVYSRTFWGGFGSPYYYVDHINCLFDGNTAESQGGAVYHQGDRGYDPGPDDEYRYLNTFVSCTFASNRSEPPFPENDPECGGRGYPQRQR